MASNARIRPDQFQLGYAQKKLWMLYTILRIPYTEIEGIKCVYTSIFLRICDKYGFTTPSILLFPAESVIVRLRPLNRYIP